MKGQVTATASGEFSEEERQQGSTPRELLAMLKALETFQKWSDCNLLVASDNTAAVTLVREAAGRSESTVKVMRRLNEFLITHRIDPFPIHCPREQGFIPLCDQLSKKLAPVARPGPSGVKPRGQTEWSLNRGEFALVVRPLLETEFVDAFASPKNAKCKNFCTELDCPFSLGNGLNLCWERRCIYAFPPFSLLPLVLAKIEATSRRRVVLVTKDFSTSPLWVMAVRLAIQEPTTIPKRRGLLLLDGMPGEELFDLLVWMFRT